MVEMDQIRQLSDLIAKEFNARRIILFGSYASDMPSADSDVDILVILPFEGKSTWKSLEILNRIKPGFPVDLLARTPQQVEQRLEWNDFFMREIIEKGKVLYEADNA